MPADGQRRRRSTCRGPWLHALAPSAPGARFSSAVVAASRGGATGAPATTCGSTMRDGLASGERASQATARDDAGSYPYVRSLRVPRRSCAARRGAGSLASRPRNPRGKRVWRQRQRVWLRRRLAACCCLLRLRRAAWHMTGTVRDSPGESGRAPKPSRGKNLASRGLPVPFLWTVLVPPRRG